MGREGNIAQQISDEISKLVNYHKRWGTMASPNTDSTQMLRILYDIQEHGLISVEEGPTREEITKVKRQLTACQAREAKLKKEQDR